MPPVEKWFLGVDSLETFVSNGAEAFDSMAFEGSGGRGFGKQERRTAAVRRQKLARQPATLLFVGGECLGRYREKSILQEWQGCARFRVCEPL